MKDFKEEFDDIKRLLEEERVSHRIIIEILNKDHKEEIKHFRDEIDYLKSNLTLKN